MLLTIVITSVMLLFQADVWGNLKNLRRCDPCPDNFEICV